MTEVRIDLSKREKKLLARMGLDPYQARVVENIWKKQFDMVKIHHITNALIYASALIGNIQLLLSLIYGTAYLNVLACTIVYDLIFLNIYLLLQIYSCSSVIRSSDQNKILEEYGIILTHMNSFEKRVKQGLAILFVSLGILNGINLSFCPAFTIGALSALFVVVSWWLIGSVGKARTKIENELDIIVTNV